MQQQFPPSQNRAPSRQQTEDLRSNSYNDDTREQIVWPSSGGDGGGKSGNSGKGGNIKDNDGDETN